MSRRPILVLQHGDDVPPGRLTAALAGVAHEIVPLHAGAAVPHPSGWAGIVVLGGSMGAYDDADHPFLATERAMLAAAVSAGVPVLGICLGCQQLAAALGGRAFRAERAELALVGFADSDDPVLARLDGPHLSFHQDTWTAPPGATVLTATVLAGTAAPQQAFRLGSALGIQSHPEVPTDVAVEWMETTQGRGMVAESAADADAVVAALRAGEPELDARAGRFFAAWLREVAAAQPSP